MHICRGCVCTGGLNRKRGQRPLLWLSLHIIPAHATTITHRNANNIPQHIARRGNYRHDVLAVLPLTELKFVKGREKKLKRSLECLAPEDQRRRAIKGLCYKSPLIPQKVIKWRLTCLMMAQRDVHYRRPNENAGLTI